ncbi:MAG: ArgE/DapE family deacylase [Lachnospiraceae bacterium]|nr:ArgE/DapE family deacylase [Lachnospiraceae bacterium]
MDNKQKVYDWIDQHQDEVVKLLQELIQAPSVNAYFDEEDCYKKEGLTQAVLRKHLDAMGMKTEFQYPNAEELKEYEGKPGYYADHKFEDRPNLIGVLVGEGGGKSILLSGHIDVVQRGTKWTYDPFGGTVADGKIYGRGAVDMKGGDAAMTMAVKAIQGAGLKLKGDVKIGTVVDEEAGGMGTLALMAAGNRADACLITEPTDLQIAPLCRGILWGKIVIEGRAGHIELKQGDWREGGAVDAIEKGLKYLRAIKNLNQDWAITKTHKYMTLPCEVNLAEFHAGEYPTTFANHAEIVFDAQYLPREKDENGLGSKVKKELEDFVAAVAQTDDWLRENPPYIEWMIDADCGETLDDQPFFQQVVKSAREVHPESGIEGIGFHTDMGWFCNVGIPTINIGPGNPRLAHHSDEFVTIEDMITCTKMIASIIMDWCEVAE